MSTGPQGQQGIQGDYGPRGVTGAFGWGYGTTTGPTGTIGSIKITIPETAQITMTSDNASSLFRVKDATVESSTSSYVTLVFPTGLTASNTGQFWTFSNDVYPNGFSEVPTLGLVKDGVSGSFVTIKPYAHATLVYNGGTTGYLADYTLF